MDSIYEDLRHNLRTYINQEKKRIDDKNDFNVEALIKDLKMPERFLPGELVDDIQSHRRNFPTDRNNILSFNYTESIDKILSTSGATKEDIKIHNSLHIHRLTDKIIFGVNDESQIANKELAKNENVGNLLIKPKINATYRDRHILNCTKLIDDANLICLFGVSMGDTDRYWWMKIGDRLLTSSTKLIFYQFLSDEEYYDYSNDGPHQFNKENALRKEIMKKMGLTKVEEASYRARIYIDIMKREDHIFNIGSV